MSTSGPFLPVSAPTMPAPSVGLTSSATEINRPAEARWTAGFTYTPEACFAGEVLEVCPPAPVNKNTEQHGPPRAVFPFALKASDECSTFGLDLSEYQARAERLLNRSETKLAEGEFWVGSVAGWSAAANGNQPFEITLPSNHISPGYNPTLAGPGAFILNNNIGASLAATLGATQANIDVNIPAAAGFTLTAKAGLAAIEDALGACGSGAPGFIHAPRSVVTAWNNENLLLQRGDQIVTILGNIVVGGAGYPGTAPPVTADLAAGFTLPPAGESWVYATSPVEFRRDSVVEIGIPDIPTRGVNRATNDVVTIAERLWATYFNECCHIAALVDAC